LEIREGVWWAAFGKKEIMSIFLFFFVVQKLFCCVFIFFKQVGGLKTHQDEREKRDFALLAA